MIVMITITMTSMTAKTAMHDDGDDDDEDDDNDHIYQKCSHICSPTWPKGNLGLTWGNLGARLRSKNSDFAREVFPKREDDDVKSVLL